MALDAMRPPQRPMCQLLLLVDGCSRASADLLHVGESTAARQWRHVCRESQDDAQLLLVDPPMRRAPFPARAYVRPVTRLLVILRRTSPGWAAWIASHLT